MRAGYPIANSKPCGGTTYHILVVDDELDIRELLRRFFEPESYTVDLAKDGREAWRKIQDKKYDCMFLDLKMPRIGGEDLYQLILGISENLASKVIFITGDTVSRETRDFVSKSGNFVITKPFSREELLQTVSSICVPQQMLPDEIRSATRPTGHMILLPQDDELKTSQM